MFSLGHQGRLLEEVALALDCLDIINTKESVRPLVSKRELLIQGSLEDV